MDIRLFCAVLKAPGGGAATSRGAVKTQAFQIGPETVIPKDNLRYTPFALRVPMNRRSPHLGQGKKYIAPLLADAVGVCPCFTPGTQIATRHGETPVENLRVGDKVITRDNGLQDIRWIGRVQMFAQAFQAQPHLLPILIEQGALGRGLPERDLLVSPNHRILVESERTSLLFREPEVLVAAKHLTAGHAVHTVASSGTTYFHLLFDRHEVILSNGAWTESFEPNDNSLKAVGNAQRLEVFELFPALKTARGAKPFRPLRRILSQGDAEDLSG